MAPTQPNDISTKVLSCKDSRNSKNQIAAKPKPKAPSIGTVSNPTLQQQAAVISPDKRLSGKGGLVEVDPTSDHGMTGTGTNSAVDLTNEATSESGLTDEGSEPNDGTEDDDGDLTNGGSKMD